MDGPLPLDLKPHNDTGKHVGVRLPYTNTNLLPDNKWTWSDADQKGWKLVTDGYQNFYEYWRGPDHPKFRSEFPYKLSLGVGKSGESLLPGGPTGTSANEILVTESYNKVFYRLLRLRNKDMGNANGAVLTGQSGIGLSL